MVVHDAANQLLHRSFALGRPHLPAEILGDDDVGGLLGPEARHLDVALLEDHLALLVADDRRAQLPVDFVERVHAWAGEVARELEAYRLRRSAIDLVILMHRLRQSASLAGQRSSAFVFPPPKKTARPYAPIGVPANANVSMGANQLWWRDLPSRQDTGCWDHPAFARPRATSTDYAPMPFRLSSSELPDIVALF